jgi:hypothetical protein
VTHEWDLDGDGIYDTSGPLVPWLAPAVGLHPVELRVTDDNAPPKTDSDLFVVDIVNRPPLAEPGLAYEISEGQSLQLDASGSFDPDAPCGDSIAEYQWDLNGDGLYDLSGPDAVVPVDWPFLASLIPPLLYPADPGTGLPNNPITLRVVDTLGEEALAGTTLTIYAP